MAFAAAMSTQRAILGCLGRKVSSALAARVHRAEGLAAFLGRETEQAQRCFAAARASDPAIGLPEAMAPEGGPLRAAWDVLPAAEPTVPLANAAAGSLYVDGFVRFHVDAASNEALTMAPSERPFVLQAVTSDEVALWTVWAPDAGRVPAYDRAPPSGSADHRWAWWATGGAALGAGALLGAAYLADGNYRGSTTVEEADQRREVVNGLTGASAGFGVAALGLGLVAVAGTF